MSGTGIANGALSIISALTAASYIITMISYDWAVKTDIAAQQSATKTYRGLWQQKVCLQYETSSEVCNVNNPYESLSISARPSWNLFAIFMMPLACVLSISASITALAALPQLRRFNTKPTCLMSTTAVFMVIAGLAALITGIWFTVAVNTNSVDRKTSVRKASKMKGRKVNVLQYNTGWAAILTLITGGLQLIAAGYACYKVADRVKSKEPEEDLALRDNRYQSGYC